MTRHELEYRISQYLDGTLPPQAVADLLRRVEEDGEARELLELHRRIHAAIKAGADATALPSLDWNKVAQKLSASVSTSVSAGSRQVTDESETAALELSEELEGAIVAFIDGTLDERDRPMIEARLASDPAARKLADEYRSLHAILDHGLALPEVRWEPLSCRISAEIDAQSADEVLSDEREFELTEYLAGGLDPERVAAIESQLSGSGAARRALREHAQLDGMLKGLPMVSVNYDLLAERIAEAIDGQQSERMSISFWMRKAAPYAVAACVVIASAIAFKLSINPPNNGGTTPVVARTGSIDVQVLGGPRAEASGASVIEIDVGPSDTYAGRSFELYSPGVVYRPQRVQLAETVRYVMEPQGGFLE